MHIFTITAGRTGTAWLAEFVRANLRIESVHEATGVDDFGTRTPDIRTMRHFNEMGTTPLVRKFWEKKFAGIAKKVDYCETNHTLAKCGLVEHLAQLSLDDVVLVSLRRDWTDQALSYIVRRDFANTTMWWQWYLDYRYRNNIVPHEDLVRGPYDVVIWYIAEIEARQHYYRSLYEDVFRIFDCTIEDIASEDGARRLLTFLRSPGEPVMPEPRNVTPWTPDAAPRAKVAEAIARARLDPAAQAADFLATGKRLGLPA